MGFAPLRACVVLPLVAGACGFDSSGSGTGAAEIGETSATPTDDDSNPSDDGGATTMAQDTGAPDSTGGGGTTTTAGSTSSSSSDASAGSTDSTTGAIEWGPFQPPVVVNMVNSGFSDDDPTLRGDLLEMVFASDRSLVGEDMWIAVRPDTSVDFGDPTALPEPLNLQYTNETTPELSIDGLVLTFASDRSGGTGLQDLYVTSRADLDSAWAAPVRVDELATVNGEVALVTTADGLIGYFCRWVDFVNYEQLLRTTRPDADADWGAAVELTINSPTTECSPWVDGDATELWFDSTRAGGQGLDDIWRADLDGANAGEPEVVIELNSVMRDQDAWLSPAGDIIVFSSDRIANMDLYYSVRTPL